MTDKEINSFSLRITQSSATALTALTMEIARVYVNDAVSAIEVFGEADGTDDDSRAAQAYAKAVRCASLCIDHLITSLDMEQGISRELLLIYQYIKNNLRHLKRKPQRELLKSIDRMLSSLQASFEKLAKDDKSGPMMHNTQKVYAGLTYGQGTLNETYDSDFNRGYLV